MAKDARAEAQRLASKNGSGKGLTFTKITLIGVVVIACILAVFIVFNANKSSVPSDSGTVPKGGNEYGGVTLVNVDKFTDTGVASISSENITPGTPGEDLGEGPEAAPRGTAKNNLVMYADMNCVHCAEFDENYGAVIKQWVKQGVVSFEVRMVGFLDSGSPTNYSSRAANALACTAESGPAKYLDFMGAVFDRHDGGEMSNKELISVANELGLDISECVEEGTFRPFVQAATLMAQSDGVAGTPALFMNGKSWSDGGLEDWVESNRNIN